MRGKKLISLLLVGTLCFGMGFTSQASSASEAKKEASKAKEKADKAKEESQELKEQKEQAFRVLSPSRCLNPICIWDWAVMYKAPRNRRKRSRNFWISRERGFFCQRTMT